MESDEKDERGMEGGIFMNENMDDGRWKMKDERLTQGNLSPRGKKEKRKIQSS